MFTALQVVAQGLQNCNDGQELNIVHFVSDKVSKKKLDLDVNY